MEKLNVACSSCKVGNVVVIEMVQDDYEMGCSKCSHKFAVHYTGFDNIYDEHEFNSQICKDIKVLHANGKWERDSVNQFMPKDFVLADFTKGMKLIQTIEIYETLRYYQKGASFYKVVENTVHNHFGVYKYQASEDGVKSLMSHFYGVKA